MTVQRQLLSLYAQRDSAERLLARYRRGLKLARTAHEMDWKRRLIADQRAEIARLNALIEPLEEAEKRERQQRQQTEAPA